MKNQDIVYAVASKMEDMRIKALLHIDREFKLLRTFNDPHKYNKTLPNRQNKIVGMLSLAKELELITTEEYESYYEELFNN